MTTVIGEKLTKALEGKTNDINSYVWKGPKKVVNGVAQQESIKLMDATPEQLNHFYTHCMSMLYSKDRKNPGRYVLLDIVDEQRQMCNTELFIRWIENKYKTNNPTRRDGIPRFVFRQTIDDYLNREDVRNAITKDKYSSTSIDAIIGNLPDEFKSVNIEDVRNACVDAIGQFDKSHLSLNFIVKLGIWFTPQEKKDLEEIDPETGKLKDKLQVIKERHGLKNNVHLRTSQNGLSYAELRAMLNLKSKRYSELTTDQLLTLRNKVLFRFQSEIEFHASQWEERIKQLQEVAKARGLSLKEETTENEKSE